ncbi:PQQ-dependent dehydrogenase, methanol/ethanol family [Porphyrobacter algicida]|uniref:PQQ-dependent dehydrogenase, methanol/ethanol family n=1 Tax=Qipengyuania algicida TaxID=1836209 RepID=A0A845ACE6_9SPHN|nr:PQQ-dependent dehydrogenase, methanol/ethanol family [Qipengyuania algicida]MXP28122.1 PQQ-dependent dehydrogenase, methanol/ethanol family [Qipengyuania algicida]
MRKGIFAVLAAGSLAACSMASDPGSSADQSRLATQGVTDALIARGPGNEWLTYGGGPNEQRFSPLDQINAENVGQLKLAWYADLDTARGQEATPLMHDGTLFVTTAWSMVKAYDATTGKLKWAYDPQVPRETLIRTCCDAVNRGVALYGDKAFVGTLDGRLVALDQKTGKVLWSKTVVPDQKSYTITGAPRIAKGLVLIGSGGAEYRARGYLAAYDPDTGARKWIFHTVPGNPADGFENAAMEKAAGTWAGDWWKLGGGGTVWDSITYDPQTGLVYFGTGNAEPWNPAAMDRGDGDSLYTGSIVAVDAATGQYRWHFQETPEDRWDFDSDAQITVADLTIGGKQRHVILHAPKNGFVYVLDARTGEFLSGKGYVPQNWTSGLDKNGRPVILAEARYEKTGKPFLGTPGAMGAHSWQPMSFSPKTGLLYIPTNYTSQAYLAEKDWEPSAIGFQVGLDAGSVAMPANKAVRAAFAKQYTGALVAWDPVKQEKRWSIPYPGPWNGGTLATAGNLVFQGTAKGGVRAYSADNGKQLWTFPAQTGVIAAPMTYSIDGTQYVAVLAGWGGVYDLVAGVLHDKSGPVRNVSRLLVFKLGGTAKLPPAPSLNQVVLDPPAFKGTAAQVARGSQLYGRYCSVCHGDAAVGGSLVPDLRRSGAIASPDAIRAIVIDGALKHNGMVSFASAIKPEGAEDIRQYIIKRANEDAELAKQGKAAKR